MFYKKDTLTIDIAYCLWHKVKRPDAKEKITNNIKNLGLDTTYLKFFTVGRGEDYEDDYNFGEYRHPNQASLFCRACHKKMFQNCINANYSNILFLEDDAIFTNDFVEILDKVEVPKFYHQLTLGGYGKGLDGKMIDGNYDPPYDSNAKNNPVFIKVEYCFGLFGSILPQISLQPMLNKIIDGDSRRDNMHLMDMALFYSIHPREVFMLNCPIIIEDERLGGAVNQGDYPPRFFFRQALKEKRIS